METLFSFGITLLVILIFAVLVIVFAEEIYGLAKIIPVKNKLPATGNGISNSLKALNKITGKIKKRKS